MGGDPAAASREAAGLGRFGARAALGWTALVLGAVPFLLLWLLVARSWPPLARVDAEVADGLNAAVSGSPGMVDVLRTVTDLGGHEFAILALGLTTVFLLIRRRPRLAVFVAATGAGMGVLGPVTKALVDRARPVVETAVVQTPSNASFPSGHAMTSLVVGGVFLLVVLPAVRRRTRPWLVAVVAVTVLAVGFTRLALGVHFVSDVLAGYALGTGWLAVTTAAFRVWQHERGRYAHEPLDPLDVPPLEAAHLDPPTGPILPAGRRSAAWLGGTAAALAGGLAALGLLVTDGFSGSWLGELDRSIVTGIADARTETRTNVATAVSSLAGTPAVVAVGLTALVLALAITGRRRPAVFVVVAVVGELLLYFATSQIVGRARPRVTDLTAGLPTAASWPSGHTAVAAALYGAVAALVITYARTRWRWAALALPVALSPGVGVSRIYLAAHYPTDVVAGLLLGGLWVLACTFVLLRREGPDQRIGLPPVTAIRAPET